MTVMAMLTTMVTIVITVARTSAVPVRTGPSPAAVDVRRYPRGRADEQPVVLQRHRLALSRARVAAAM
jgi:hypothetical protein